MTNGDSAIACVKGYINMGKYLNATGRPILYACSWPAYISNPNYTVIAEYCNQWRNQDDIQDSFDNSVLHIIQEYVQNQVRYFTCYTAF